MPLILIWQKKYDDHEGGFSRMRLVYCSLDVLSPAISPNMKGSTAQFVGGGGLHSRFLLMYGTANNRFRFFFFYCLRYNRWCFLNTYASEYKTDHYQFLLLDVCFLKEKR